MKRSSDSPAVAGPCSGALHVAHGEESAHGPGIAKATTVSRPSVQVRFKAAREAAGLSQHKCGVLWGCDRRTISRWEAGKSPLPAKALDWIEEWASELGNRGNANVMASKAPPSGKAA
jgi:DNA-binding transcriptional regulator YiaG